MATAAPLMPKATAVWLLDNTALSFDQIADFCKLHPLEVKAIADGDAAQGIKGLDPIQTGQLTREQIAEAEANHEHQLDADRAEGRGAAARTRQERPALHAGVAPAGPAERDPLAGAQSSRAQGQRDHAAGRHHQVDHRGDPRPHPLERGQPGADGPGDARPCHADRPRFRGQPRQQGKAGAGRTGATLLPAAETTARKEAEEAAAAAAAGEEAGRQDLDVSAVFAKLKQLGGKGEKEDE